MERKGLAVKERLVPTSYVADGDDWSIDVEDVSDEAPRSRAWHWAVWVQVGHGGIEWDGYESTDEKAQVSARAALARLRFLMPKKKPKAKRKRG
jgi:hypothetical protein